MYREKFEVGLNLLEQAEFEEAIEVFSEIAADAFERAIKANPNEADAYYLLGTAMGASGDIDKALDFYKKAVEIEPEHQKANEFLLRTQTLVESREHYRRALILLSDDNKSSKSTNLAIQELLLSISIFHNSPARHNLVQIIDDIINAKKESNLHIDTIKDENKLWAKNCEKGFRFLKKGLWESAIWSAGQGRR